MSLKKWREGWRFLTQPAASIQTEEERQQASLSAALSLALLAMGIIVLSIWIVTNLHFKAAPFISLGTIIPLALAYLLSRTAYYRLGPFILIFSLLFMVALIVATAPGPISERMLALNFLVVAILLASILLPVPATLFIAGICLAGTALFYFVPGVPSNVAYSFLVFMAVMAGLLIVATVIRNESFGKRQQAEEEVRRRTAQLEALRQGSLELTAQLELPDLLHSIVMRAIELVGGSSGGLYFYRPDRDVLEWTVAVGPYLAPLGATLRRGEGLSGKVWKSGRPLIVDDYQHWPGRAAIYQDYPFAAVMAVPVRWGQEFLAVLNVNADAPHSFSPADAELLSLFATQAAIAIRNARLYEETQRRALEQETLRQAGAAVTETLSLEETLDRILEQLGQVVSYDSASVLLLQEDYLEIRGGRGFQDPETVIGLRFPVPGDNPNSQVIQRREPVILADAPAAYDPFREPPHDHIQSWLGVPLLIRERVIGMLAIDSVEPDHFGPAEARLVSPFANQAAIAVEHAQLYEQARQDAETRVTLLQEVNHRVKNNLAAIIGLLYARQRHAGSQDQGLYKAILTDLVRQVRGLATVHNLLSATGWTPLLLSELIARVAQASLQTMPRHTTKVSVNVTPSPVRVTAKQANSVALVINELVTNSIKHALPGRKTGDISVCITLVDDHVRLEYRDNGPGYPEQVLKLDQHNVGLYLIQTIVRDDLQGEMTLRNEDGAVTSLRFKATAGEESQPGSKRRGG